MSTEPAQTAQQEPPAKFWQEPSLTNWISLVTLLTAIVGSYALAQAQIAEHGRRIVRLELRDEQSRIDYASVRELLVRIDERTAEIKRRQDIDK